MPDTAVTGIYSLQDILGALGDGWISVWTEKQERGELECSVGTGLKPLLGTCALNACS